MEANAEKVENQIKTKKLNIEEFSAYGEQIKIKITTSNRQNEKKIILKTNI